MAVVKTWVRDSVSKAGQDVDGVKVSKAMSVGHKNLLPIAVTAVSSYWNRHIGLPRAVRMYASIPEAENNFWTLKGEPEDDKECIYSSGE